MKILDATLLQVDPTTYGERQAKAAAQRDVKATQSSDGLRTLVARGTSGDVTMFLALVDAIAEALADEGDEDPYPVRKSKAIGIAAYPDRAQDLLSRGRHREDPKKDPWEQVDAHQTDPTDPWADDLPAAGWETSRHGNYHQPGFDEEWEMPGTVPSDDDDQPDEDLVDPADLAWYDQHTCPDARPDQNDPRTSDVTGMAEPQDPPPASEPGRSLRSTGLDLRPRNADLAKSRPTVHLHMHVSDQTVRDGRGVVRTDHGPITVDQLRHFLGDSCPTIKVHPVYDPADTAAVDSYEIPVALRRAQSIKNPASVFPFSPSTSRMDLDHTSGLRTGWTAGTDQHGQPRTPHPIRAPSEDRRRLARETTGSRALRLAIARRRDRDHHQPRHPCARWLGLHPPPLARPPGRRPRPRCRKISISVACAGGLRQAWRRRTGRLS